MRTSYAIKNTLASILVEVVAALSGVILPRFFISAYGSSINGLVSSIGQFITYMGLVEAGVSAAATVELYKPLSEDDHLKTNEIVSAAKGFYFKSGALFVVLDVILIISYPLIVKNEIADTSFVRMMIVVLSLNGIVDYFFLGKYRVLLVADQKTYIIAIAQSVGTIITLFVSIMLIYIHSSAVLVKGVVAAVYILRTFYIVYYVRKHYMWLDCNSKYAKDAFPQRQSALFHQVIGMICNNTDIVLLTVMLQSNALVEVSVYATYNMVAANLTSLFNSFSRGIGASFGKMIAKNDQESLNVNFSYFEMIYFVLLFIVYTCMAVLLYAFISLYSVSFSDTEVYLRWSLVALFTACGVAQNIRIPGLTVQIAAGHFKQTQGAALLEAVLNFGVSIALVRFIGINGVLLGTFVAYLYRSSYVIIYNAKHFVCGSLKRTAFRFVRNFLLFALLTTAGIVFLAPCIHSWITWIVYAIILGIISAIVFIMINFIFEPKVVRDCVRYAKATVSRK